ncbi:MAG: hypothetical protein FJX77_17070 [Armatimonadetes bacterium]|nr:hypothetical protein [Armatimonadota bacterium]
MRLEKGARVVAVLDRGDRYVLAGPVRAVVRPDAIVRQEGSGSVHRDAALPAAPPPSRASGLPGRVAGQVLRSSLAFRSPTPACAALKLPVTVAWTRPAGLEISQWVLRVSPSSGDHPLLTRELAPDLDRLELAAALPRGQWLQVTLTAQGPERTLSTAQTWLRIATPPETTALAALQARVEEHPQDAELRLLLAQRQLALGFLEEAGSTLGQLPAASDHPGAVSASASELHRQIQASRARLHAAL